MRRILPILVTLNIGCNLVVFDTSDTASLESDTGSTHDTGASTDSADTADTAVWTPETFTMDDADALFVLGAYNSNVELGAGDVNGDGQAEFFLIDNDESAAEYTYGYVVPGASVMASTYSSTDKDGLVELVDDVGTIRTWTAGKTLGSVGDIDGDGVPEVTFPQPTGDMGPFVFSGATMSTDRFTDGLAPTSEADLTIASADTVPRYTNLSLTALGAPSGGGTLQVAAYMYDASSGATYLYPLPETGSSLALSDAAATIETSRVTVGAGEVDVDGDGTPELLELSTTQDTRVTIKPMALYLFDLPPDGSTWTESEARALIEDPVYAPRATGDSYSVLLPGDLDGDGLEDLILMHEDHSPDGDVAAYGTVAAVTTLGSLSGSDDLRSDAAWRIVGSAINSHLGVDAALVPDVDGDGAPEILTISSWSATTDHDSAVAFLSSRTGDGGVYSESDADRLYDITDDDHVTERVASADLDGDGNPELLVSYYEYERYGGAYIFSW